MKDLQGTKDTYIAPLAQLYLESPIFVRNKLPLHTHVRKVSILSSNGEIVHNGYVCKITDKDNSSAY
jgi:hypothetical protein